MEKKKKVSVLLQIAILFIVAVILIGALSIVTLYRFSTRYVLERLEISGNSTAEDLKSFIYDFPAHDWLLRYWYEHSDEMEIEYDTIYYGGSETEEKYVLLTTLHPDFWPDYASTEDVEALPPEEQKLYAEIVYSWLIDRIDYIQSAYDLDYFLCVVTDDPYDKQSVLFIAADEGEIRGPERGQIYPIGKEVKVSGEKQEAMREAVSGHPKAAIGRDQKYYDYFYYMTSIDEHKVLIVQTIDVMRVREAVTKYLFDFGFLFAFLLVALAFSCMLMINYLVLLPLKKVQENIGLYVETKDSRMVADNLLKIESHNEIAELSSDLAGMAEELTAYMVRNEQIAVKEGGTRAVVRANSIYHNYDNSLAGYFKEYAAHRMARVHGTAEYNAGRGCLLIDVFHDGIACRRWSPFFDEDLGPDWVVPVPASQAQGLPFPSWRKSSRPSGRRLLLENNVKMGKSPAQTLSDINTAICNKNIEDMFVTVWLGIIDLSTGKMICANAGHEYPMLKKPGERYEIIKDKHDLVLGAMKGWKYDEYELLMEPGASLFLYTDGLSETINPQEKMFGTDRILEQLNTNPNCSTEETLTGMKEAVDKYIDGKEPFDDLTMMSFAYHGPTE